ncbi:MAG TPA: TlpA disulfide reductase family protein [Pyrinomonadaceae bacterium]|nr:TlpA disulfide reductase family protein [Pyrinomonadaceae bacterium]
MIRNKFIFFTILFFLFAFISCSNTASPEITISGELKNVPNNKVLLTLEEDINRKKSRVIAEISLDQNGRFKFDRDLVPNIYSLKINDKKSVTLALDRGQNVVISGDAADSKTIKVAGSDDTAKLEAYEKFRQESLKRLVISVRNQIKELKEKNTPESDPKMVELSRLELENYDKHKDEMIEFVKKEMGASIAIYPTSVRWDGEKNIPFLNELAKQFEAKHPDLAITEKVKEKVRILTNNSLGGQVAEISMPDKNDQIIPLSSIKGKLILIDFWGSWCAPCRRESTELSELYQKYQPKGFEIYGVALESEKESWLKAIEHDKRVWTNVASFTEFETPTAFDYAVTSLPANFLIDENGKVIAKNLHDKELMEKLETIFGQ